jgi:SHS2 domain-containing protein
MKSILSNEMKNYVMPDLQIDSHQAKLGRDEDVSVLKIDCTNKTVAEDLVNFIETGYKFVLDADHTPAKNQTGLYHVFVELERNEQLPENIINLIRDVEKVTGMMPWHFKFYKNDQSYKLTAENVQSQIPTNPSEYTFLTDDSIDEDIKTFFESSDVKNIKRNGKNITLYKKYVKHNFIIESFNQKNINGVYRIDESASSQSSYVQGWLGGSYHVVKVDDLFKISKDNMNILVRTEEF